MEVAKLNEKEITLAVNTIKMLSVDAVEKAKSGHPGLPMGCADIAFVLWMNFLKYNPHDPNWENRDRFILSAGHGSALLYTMLHLSGYNLPMEEIQNFRQAGSATPGHPEFRHTRGVETTTGPLGQGFGNGVGMAIAEKILASHLNKNGINIIDHYIYSIVSDGDIMEGISAEAASMAGHLGLSKLIYIYDSNSITIEGETHLALTEDVGLRFKGYNWHVQHIDGHNHNEIINAVKEAQNEKERPNLIIAKTNIGKGSPNKQDKASAHGEPLGENEVLLTKKAIGWPEYKKFYIPEEVTKLFSRRLEELRPEYEKWHEKLDTMLKNNEFASLWNARIAHNLPADLTDQLLSTIKKDSIATRQASGDMMQVISKYLPYFAGGSADLSPSTRTFLNDSPSITKNQFKAKNLHFGIREHGMGSILNGMSVYGGFVPFGSTFLIFSDYMRPTIRLAALMKAQVIYVFTHDSVFLGEDGPTHQPVEQLDSLRLIPGILVIRPSDATETASAWKAALEHKDGPTALILTRQNLPVLNRQIYKSQDNLKFGAYQLNETTGIPDMTIIASGSEVALAISVAEELQRKNMKIKIVSAPCLELFRNQDIQYKNSLLPDECSKYVVIEAGRAKLWYEFIGKGSLIIGIDKFGTSAPAKDIAPLYGLTKEAVLAKIKEKWDI